MALANLDLNFAYLIAQSSFVSPPDIALLGIVLIIAIIIYVFLSSCLYTILINLGQPNAWFAWVPILSNWAILKAGNQSPWWSIGIFAGDITHLLINIYSAIDPSSSTLYLLTTISSIFTVIISLLAIIAFLFAWVNIINQLGKNPWLIILFIIPIVNFFVMHHLAYGY